MTERQARMVEFWRARHDTMEIAHLLDVPESEVYNFLAGYRARAYQIRKAAIRCRPAR